MTNRAHALPALAVVVGLLAAVGVGLAVYRSTNGQRIGPTAHGTDVSRSSTVAWSVDRSRLWVTSPDDDQVVEINADTLAVGRRVPVAGQPQELTRVGRRLLVTSVQSSTLTVIELGDSAKGRLPSTRAIPLPCGGSLSVVGVPQGVAGAASDLAVVTCPNDDRLAVVDLAALRTVAQIRLVGRPTGVLRSGRQLTISTSQNGRLHSWDLGDLVNRLPAARASSERPLPVLHLPAPRDVEAWADGERSPSQLGALDAGRGGPVGLYQMVDNRRELSATQLMDGSSYGKPLDGRARLEPALAGACGARFASFDRKANTLSGPVALATSPTSDLVWVVGQFSHSVSVVRCDGGSRAGRSATVASFDVGAGARGIALDSNGRTAYVDVGFDHAIARLELTGGQERRAPARVRRRRVADLHLSPLAQQGRRMFTDATNTHLTPVGVVTCASCHESAGDDGLTWRIESSKGGRKVRRTPTVWQLNALSKPLHWDGEFATANELTLSTIQNLLGGDGLLIDPSGITAYMAESLAPPATPTWAATDRSARARGEMLFNGASVGCVACHTGPSGTDGRAHDVLPKSTEPAARLTDVFTPTLFGVRTKAPFGHDGAAADLGDLLRRHRDAQGRPIDLTNAELADVIAYLNSR